MTLASLPTLAAAGVLLGWSSALADPADDIAAANVRFPDAFNAGDPAAAAAVHAENAIVLASGWKPGHGRDAVETMFTAFFKAGFHDLARTYPDLDFINDTAAVEVNIDTARRTDGKGKTTDHTFKALTVWRKDATGDWFIYRDSFNGMPGS